jgi:hypothetical protein
MRRETTLARQFRRHAGPAVRTQRTGLLRRILRSQAAVVELLAQVSKLLLMLRTELQDRVSVRTLLAGAQVAQLPALLRLQLANLRILVAAKLARLRACKSGPRRGRCRRTRDGTGRLRSDKRAGTRDAWRCLGRDMTRRDPRRRGDPR